MSKFHNFSVKLGVKQISSYELVRIKECLVKHNNKHDGSQTTHYYIPFRVKLTHPMSTSGKLYPPLKARLFGYCSYEDKIKLN